MKRSYQYWKMNEIKSLIENFHQMSGKELSSLLNRSTHSIKARAFSLRLKKNAPTKEKNIYKYWNMEKVNFLLENYNKMTNEELAKILDCTYNSISTKASMMGLRKDKSFFRRHAIKTNP